MSRTARLWKGAGPLTLGGLILSGAVALAGDPPASSPLADQLISLGKQAKAQGKKTDAAKFFAQALKQDPKNAEARRGLDSVRSVRLAARQEPADDTKTPPPPPPAPAPIQDDKPATSATLANAAQLERVVIQEATATTNERIDEARRALDSGNPAAAIDILRLGRDALRADDRVPEAIRKALDAKFQAQMLATDRKADELDLTRADALRLQQAAQQRVRTLEQMDTNQQTIASLMTRFDTLMSQGIYNLLFNGGTGDIAASIAPFAEAHLYAQQARAIDQAAVAPRAGVLTSQFMGSLANELAMEELKEYRFLLTMNDVTRTSVPFPDTITIEYPTADHWRMISEKRIRRYESVSLEAQDPKTQRIVAEMNKPISMPFPNETPFEDVLKYITTATTGEGLDKGIPIYVDPVGLQEAEKTMSSPVTLNLEGVPLKKALKLLLAQLEMTYTVKDGLLTITSKTSKDQPTEIRVYPVADLAIIPFSLMGGGGGGMGGGGMGGMGGGMGGGGMGGMGGGGMGGGGMGGGGMGGGGMGGGGFRSIPAVPPQAPAGAFEQKKSR